MGRARVASSAAPPEEVQLAQQPTTEEKVAALVAAILAGTVAVPNPTLGVAEALLSLTPLSLPEALAIRISADVARLVVQVQITPARAGAAETAAREDNLVYR
ncbi:MAG: hypothetical protein WKF67_05555, partial [Rubrobacteraceae bacterium]